MIRAQCESRTLNPYLLKLLRLQIPTLYLCQALEVSGGEVGGGAGAANGFVCINCFACYWIIAHYRKRR